MWYMTCGVNAKQKKQTNKLFDLFLFSFVLDLRKNSK